MPINYKGKSWSWAWNLVDGFYSPSLTTSGNKQVADEEGTNEEAQDAKDHPKDIQEMSKPV